MMKHISFSHNQSWISSYSDADYSEFQDLDSVSLYGENYQNNFRALPTASNYSNTTSNQECQVAPDYCYEQNGYQDGNLYDTSYYTHHSRSQPPVVKPNENVHCSEVNILEDSKKSKRLTDNQVKQLENVFVHYKYLGHKPMILETLMEHTRLAEQRIKSWFQNKRAKAVITGVAKYSAKNEYEMLKRTSIQLFPHGCLCCNFVSGIKIKAKDLEIYTPPKVHTPEQLQMLEDSFAKNRYISRRCRDGQLNALAKRTSLSKAEILFWYQKRRNREKQIVKKAVRSDFQENVNIPTNDHMQCYPAQIDCDETPVNTLTASSNSSFNNQEQQSEQTYLRIDEHQSFACDPNIDIDLQNYIEKAIAELSNLDDLSSSINDSWLYGWPNLELM